MSLPTRIDLAVYSCLEDVVLLVPAMTHPPREAEAMFGPLSREGTLSVRVADDRWNSILGQIERHLFATVPRPEAELLADGTLMRCPQSAMPLSPAAG
jgi:hypothetical protein